MLAHAQPKNAAAALAPSFNQLIREAKPDARRMLWMIAVANEPVTLSQLKSVWSGEEDHEQQQLRQIKQMLDMLPLLPPEMQAKLKALPPGLRARLDDLPPEAPARAELALLLRQLVSVGLATEELTGPEDGNPDLSCHELVRERIRAWMAQQPQDRGEFTENAIRLRRARPAGAELTVPRVAQLLADPAFDPLEQWFRQRQLPEDQWQSAVDQFLEQARQAALAQPKT